MLSKDIDLSLVQLNAQHFKEVLEFIGQNYGTTEPLCQSLKLSPEIIKAHFGVLIQACCQSGYSFAFYDGSTLASVLIAMTYEPYSQISLVDHPQTLPMEQIIDLVEESYSPKDPSKTIAIVIGCTNEEYRNKSCFTKLISQTEMKGIENGFTEFTADCTNSISQHVMISKLGYKRVCSFSYADFKFGQQYPFAEIKGCSHVELVNKIVPENDKM